MLVTSFLISASAVLCIIGIVHAWPDLFNRAGDVDAIQASHDMPTARLGGAGIIIGLTGALAMLASAETFSVYIVILLSAAPIFLTGLSEDLGWHVSPKGRLLATTVGCTLGVVLTGAWVPVPGLIGFDTLLSFMPVAILVTILWSVGLCNAFNLIDGVNGLVGATAVGVALALFHLATNYEQESLAIISRCLLGAALGFLVFNWPLGKIFLGDAGAYSLGHVLGWLAILLAWEVAEISVAALSLLFFWPVADTFAAMRRRAKTKRDLTRPDYLHFHQLVMRSLQLRYGRSLSRKQINSLTSVALLPFVFAPIGLGVLLIEEPYWAIAAWLLYGALFATTYKFLLRRARQATWRRIYKVSRISSDLRGADAA